MPNNRPHGELQPIVDYQERERDYEPDPGCPHEEADRQAELEARQDAYEEYRTTCFESGEAPCIDIKHHKWVISDENDNVCYCEKCGCPEY